MNVNTKNKKKITHNQVTNQTTLCIICCGKIWQVPLSLGIPIQWDFFPSSIIFMFGGKVASCLYIKIKIPLELLCLTFSVYILF